METTKKGTTTSLLSNRKNLIISALGILLWFGIVLPILVTRILNKDDPLLGLYADKHIINSDGVIDESSFSGIYINFGFYNVEAVTRNINLYGSIKLYGKDYATEVGLPVSNMTCDFVYTNSALTKDKPVPPISLKIPMIMGNILDYPFEQFISRFTVNCQDSKKQHIPLVIDFEPSLQIYSPSIIIEKISELDDEVRTGFQYIDLESVGVAILVEQPIATKVFSIFINLVMWSLAISLSIVTFDVVINRRENPAFLAMGTTILFAITNLRNVQPGSPPMGCLSDILGFFWCISIIALCAIVNIFAFSLRWRKPASKVV